MTKPSFLVIEPLQSILLARRLSESCGTSTLQGRIAFSRQLVFDTKAAAEKSFERPAINN